MVTIKSVKKYIFVFLFLVHCPEPENTLWSFERGSMLKTLDPILITIIAMSAVGVLLGAVCGVLFYCACAHTSDRNLSALENYNFELVDGVKLQKEKLSAQKSYTEAWEMPGEVPESFQRNVLRTSFQTEAFYSQDVRDKPLGGAMYRLYSQMIVYSFVCLFVHLLLEMRPRQKYVSSHTVWFSLFYETPFLWGTVYTHEFSVLLCSWVFKSICFCLFSSHFIPMVPLNVFLLPFYIWADSHFLLSSNCSLNRNRLLT